LRPSQRGVRFVGNIAKGPKIGKRKRVTIEQHNVIDFVSIDRERNTILTISDHLPWDVLKDHLWHLQEKLNAYLRFVESGEIHEKYPEAKDQPVIIDIALKYVAPTECQWFFTKSETAIRKAGFSLRVRHCPQA
jgi:hypothetical protein